MSITWNYWEAKAVEIQELSSIPIEKDYGVLESTFCQTNNNREVFTCLCPGHLIELVWTDRNHDQFSSSSWGSRAECGNQENKVPAMWTADRGSRL